MKVSLKHFAIALLAVVAASLGGCTNPTDDGTRTDAISLYEKVNGDWALINITQVDETAKTAGLQPQEVSLYSQFEFGTFAISFDVDADNKPTTYRVTGSAPNFFPASGYWDLSTAYPWTNSTAPIVRLYADAPISTPTAELTITSAPGATREMELRMTRLAGGVAFVSYVYKLSGNSNAE